MTKPIRHRALLPDVTDWFAEAFHPLVGWHTVPAVQGIRVETSLEGNDYVVRAELPGIDPDKDLEVTVQRGVLTIRAERSEEEKDKNFSEFRYGSFVRSIRLPEGASEDDVRASYHDGIMTIRIGVSKPSTEAKKITVQRGPFDEPVSRDTPTPR